MLFKVRGGLSIAVLTFALTGAVAPPVAGSATEPVGPGDVQLLANCFDPCTVTVRLSGNGNGKFVTTNSGGTPNGLINCVWQNGALAPGSDCTETYCCVDRASPVTIYFTLTPSPGSKACYGIIGCISGSISSSRPLPSQNEPVQTVLDGEFTLLSYAVGVSRSGTGNGEVDSFPPGIDCPPTCGANFNYGTDLLLFANDATGSYFDHWTGACAGQAADCHLTITGLVDTTATFTLGSPPTASPPAPTPVVTPVATPVPTPKVTTKPTGTPTPGKTPTPTAAGGATAAPGASLASGTDQPGESIGPVEASASPPGGSPLAPADSLAPTAPVASAPPVVPAVAGSDLTPIVFAILGAGLLIAVGIGFAAYVLRRRPSPPTA